MASLALARLTSRKLLRIAGPDCYPYLQGLICNDMRYLYEPDRVPKRKHANNSPNSLSTFMLNPQGRAICDLIIYRTPMTRYECEFTPPGKAKEDDELWIECDASLADGIANTLYGYRVRRKITVRLEHSYSIWCLYPDIQDQSIDLISQRDSDLVNFNLACENELVSYDFTLVHDPRLKLLGLRLLSTSSDFEDVRKRIESILNITVRETSNKNYSLYRYYIGVGEGLKDHLESASLPLECNADYLGSVSFDKGCYLGQELTARIRYTGVIRKRLLPIKLNRGPNVAQPILPGTDIVDLGNRKKVGVIRNVIDGRGLALIRHDFGDSKPDLIHADTETNLTTYVPFWWKQN